jgi:putative nucleotidyltransferase with HDIG domain
LRSLASSARLPLIISERSTRLMVSDFFPSGEKGDNPLSEIIPLGLLSCSTGSRRIVELNSPVAVMLGYPCREALLGAPLDDLMQVPADAIILLEDAGSGPVPMVDRPFAMKRRDGSLVTGTVTAVARSTPDGPVIDIAIFESIPDDLLRVSLKRMERLMDGFLDAIGRIVEMKDPYTASHHRRTAHLATAIAADIGKSEAETEAIHTAAVLHDLGKLCVPMEILSKPGSLSSTEFSFIRTHPNTGREILDKVEFRWPVGSWVLQHHERLNGSGYPLGIAGGEISLEARILAVADVVEAMTSRKPYRPAHTIDTALDHISEEKGELYDPDAVDACCSLFREKGYVQPDPANLEPLCRI